MKKFKAWRYKCDHCGKINGHKWHMANHELHCTMNPERDCQMCIMVDAANELPELVAIVTKWVKHYTENPASFSGYTFPKSGEGHPHAAVFEELRESAKGCPACMLAALRIGDPKALRKGPHGEFVATLFGGNIELFDFKAEAKAVRDEHYEAANEEYAEIVGYPDC